MAYIKYRGQKHADISSHHIEPGQKGKKDPMEVVMPTKANRHPGEKLPLHRRKSTIYGVKSKKK